METFEGRDVVLKVLVGSHNYNLNTPASDRDYKIFVAPTFGDLYYSRVFSFGEQSEELDYTVHDVRKLTELLWKSNLNFLEVLYSIEKKVIPELNFLFENRDKWATMNLSAFYKATLGMHHMKMQNLFKGTATTKPLVDRFGYDTKQACHAMRCLYMVERVHNFGNVGKALRFGYEEPERKILLDLKAGRYSLDEFQEMVFLWFARTKFNHSENIPTAEPNVEAKEELENYMYQFIKNKVSPSPMACA